MEDFPKNPEEQIMPLAQRDEHPVSFEEHMLRDFGEKYGSAHEENEENVIDAEIVTEDMEKWGKEWWKERFEPAVDVEGTLGRLADNIEYSQRPVREMMKEDLDNVQEVMNDPRLYLLINNPEGSDEGSFTEAGSLLAMQFASPEERDTFRGYLNHDRAKLVSGHDLMRPENIQMMVNSLTARETGMLNETRQEIENYDDIAKFRLLFGMERSRGMNAPHLKSPEMAGALELQQIVKKNTEEAFTMLSSTSYDDKFFLHIVQDEKHPGMQNMQALSLDDLEKMQKECPDEESKRQLDKALISVTPDLSRRDRDTAQKIWNILQSQNEVVDNVWNSSLEKAKAANGEHGE